MNYVQDYDQFINEAQASLRKTYFGEAPGWGLSRDRYALSYGGKIKYSGGNLKVLGYLQDRLIPTLVGKEITVEKDLDTSTYGSFVTVKGKKDLYDLLDGIKQFIEIIKKNAHKEFKALPDDIKKYAFTKNERDDKPELLKTELNRLEYITVEMPIKDPTDPTTHSKEFITKAIKEVIPNAIDVGNFPKNNPLYKDYYIYFRVKV